MNETDVSDVLLLDLDGVAVNLIDTWLERYNRRWGSSLTRNDVTRWDVTSLVPLHTRSSFLQILLEPGFFDDLPVVPGAVAAVGKFVERGWTVRVVTSPTGADSARAKMEWVDRILSPVGVTSESIVITRHKELVRGRVVIDDKPDTLVKALADGKVVVAMGHPYNRHLRDEVDLWVDFSDPIDAWVEIVRFVGRPEDHALETPVRSDGERPVVLAFLARAGSGKTTAAEYIVREFGAERVSFAGPLKKMARDVMGFSDRQLYGDLKEEPDSRFSGMSPRRFLQALGMGARTHLLESVWLDALVRQIRARFAEGQKLFVIDDCRFVNEARRIATDPSIDGRVIRINAPERERDVGTDPSELEVERVPADLIAAHVDNSADVSKDEFLECVRGLVSDL